VRSIAVLGWHDDLVQASVDYVTDRLIDAGNREIAFGSLRRDASIRPQLDISGVWRTRLMRVGFGCKVFSAVHSASVPGPANVEFCGSAKFAGP
jgi:hypothetical protein